MTGSPVIRLAVTPGEPAGIGPELLVQLLQQPLPVQCVAVADPRLLAQAAEQLRLPLKLSRFDPAIRACNAVAELWYEPVSLAAANSFGRLQPANAHYVLATLRRAVSGCLSAQFDAMVTGPVHKGVINDAGIPFTGHTEFLAQLCGTESVVMMLACGDLRVALVTTHLPLRQVADALTAELLRTTIGIVEADLRQRFGIQQPRICVLGLNPHAGESGHLGREEIEIIEPVLRQLRAAGLHLEGPVPADTAFARAPKPGERDAYLAMYHDQGLPPLKQASFGEAVNITLGLPIIRTSVDHGTALDLAGTGRADAGSLRAAMVQAIELVQRSRKPEHE
jgi:4-hydroxythreonine-4-phosphate dehydrogenase